MDARWLCSSLIIIVIVTATNSQNIVNKWTQIDGKKQNVDSKPKSNIYRKIKIFDTQKYDDKSSAHSRDILSSNSNKQFEKFYSINQDEDSSDNERFKTDEKPSNDHSRKKRLIWMTDDGRLALPPGTVLSISPTLSLPLIRYPYSGFLSNLTMSFPLTIDFDKLGLTDNENPLGVVPPLFARSMGRAAGSFLADYIRRQLNLRSKRSPKQDNFIQIEDNELPNEHKHVFHGGERALLYGAVEDLLTTFGVNGKACLLRTICEVHSKSMHSFGLFGEVIKLFLTASKSRYADLIPEYVSAEKIGEGSQSPGECFPYYKDCPKSVFNSIQNHRYSANPDDSYNNDDQKDDKTDEHIIQIKSEEINDTENETNSRFHM